LEGEDLLNYYQMLNNAPDYKIQIPIEKLPKKEVQHCFIFEHGFFYAFSPREFQPELIHITQRFSALFEQTYRRYLDLVRAEAQAREAQIEAALEKVRSRSLAMHTSSELNEVVKVLFEKLTELQVPSTAVGIQTFIEGSNDMQAFVCGDVGTGIVINQYRLPYFDHPIVHDYLNAHKDKLEVFVGNYSKKEKDSFYDVIVKLPELKDLAAEVKTMIYNSDFYEVTIVPAEKSLIAVNDFQGNPLTESQVNILKRFAKVFDQTYTRFLDLQKSEAQAREAKIEAALERVRSRSLAMQKSDELKDVVAVLYQKFQELEFGIDKGASLVMTFSPDTNDHTQWITDSKQTYAIPFFIPFTKHSIARDQINARKKRLPFLGKLYNQQEKNEYFEYLFQHTEYKHIPNDVQKLILSSKRFGISIAFEKNSAIAIPSTEGKLVTGEEVNILKRFSRVFEQTYTRFLDLQKAEAQAIEAQIDAALEKVRSRTMAMQRSEELSETAAVLLQEFKKFGNADLIQATIGIYHEEQGVIEFRVTDWAGGGHQISESFALSMEEPTVLKPAVTAWKAKEKSFVVDLTGKELDGWINYRNKMTGVTISSADTQGRRIITISFFSKGHLSISSPLPLPKKTITTLERFASVFDGTYTRFLDLQKAEAQAREAQIEAALEKVRSRAMAMQKSDELLQVIKTLSEQLRHLGLHAEAVSFLTDGDERGYNMWLSSPGEDFLSKIYVPRIQDRTTLLFQQAKETGKRYYSYVLSKEEKDIYFQNFFDNTVLRDYPDNGKEQVYAAPGMTTTNVLLDSIILSVSNFDILPFSDQENEIINRIAFVFQQTYTRFLDLQKAEAQAKEAIKQSSLDRIRGEIASMRTTKDLERITPLIWKELTTLSIPFIRCGVFIMDDSVAANPYVPFHTRW
jgi:hypothetical protein